MSSNWLADILGEGAAFNEDTNPDRYKNLVRDEYLQEIGQKKAEYGNLENANISKAAQTAAQYGITGPAAAALQHTAIQGTQHAGNQAVGDLEAQQRKDNYAAALRDEETADKREEAKQQAYANMGQKGMALLGGALSLGTGAGLITKATPFLGGLSAALGANPKAGKIDNTAFQNEQAGNLKYQPQEVIPSSDISSQNPSDWIDFGIVNKQ